MYVHNLQGDVIGLLDNTGNVVVKYSYDAWGDVQAIDGDMADTLGKINPFRYRGYVYDEESEAYYLQSRYYMPKYARFLTADTHISAKGVAIGCNLYVYCKNSPVIRIDELGEDDWWAIYPDMGFVHRKVQEHIIEQNKDMFLTTEVRVAPSIGVFFKGGYGRVDVYREATGEIWEVKPMHSVELGKAQLQTYLTGNRLGQKLKVGERAFKGQFEVYSPSGVLLRVNYSTTKGVVGYQFEAVSSLETVLVPDAVKEEDKERVKRNVRTMSSLPGLSAGDAAFCGIGLGAAAAMLALDRRMSGVMGGCVACLY